jgi:hypothetical protein
MVSEATEERMLLLLGEILRWTKIGALNLKESLTKELTNEQQCLVYELTDGILSAREIETISKVSARTVINWWHRWEDSGFVDPSQKRQGRVQRLCSLRMLGIAVPEVADKLTVSNKQKHKGNKHENNEIEEAQDKAC